MELDDERFSIIAFVWWPFVIYSGWVTVASIANVSTYFIKIDWNGFGISQISRTIIMIVIAVIINLAATWKRNMREFALVGAWALVGIANANVDVNTTISSIAFVSAAILLLNSAIHAFINRKKKPFLNFKNK